MELKRAILWLLCALLGLLHLARPQDFPLLTGHVVLTTYNGKSCVGGEIIEESIEGTYGLCVPDTTGSYAQFLCNAEECYSMLTLLFPKIQQEDIVNNFTFIPLKFVYSTHDCSGDENSTVWGVDESANFVKNGSCVPCSPSANCIEHFVQSQSFEFNHNASGLVHSKGSGFVSWLPKPQLSALENFFMSTKGEYWKTNPSLGVPWKFTKSISGAYMSDPCKDLWFGILCKRVGDKVDVDWVHLPSSNLVGMIHSSISNLTSLSHLGLSNNSLFGKIPPTIGNLAELAWLDLSANQLSSTIPTEIVRLSRLTRISLYENSLSGEIPSAISNLTALTKLALSNNILHGKIPIVHSSVTLLYLSENRLSSTIPSELALLSELVLLSLNYNSISGQIPTFISGLSRLEQLSLASNYLQGPIPATIGNMFALTYLDLCLNSLESTIPSVLGKLTNLKYLSLWSNRLTGSIPSMANLNNLDTLKLSDNNFSPGTLPSWILELTDLRVLRLSNSSLTGPLPPGLGNLSLLVELSLASNQLTSTIPPFAGKNLVSLDLSNNFLVGVVLNPTAHAGLQNLQLSGNSLSSSIPSTLCILSDLQVFDVSGNALDRSPPVCLSNLTCLRTLSLASNQLTNAGNGLDFLLAPNLQVVDVSSNNFQGSLPADVFTSSPSLRIFAAAANCFQGKLPAEAICAAKKLQKLVLDGLNAGASCRVSILGPLNLFRFTGSVIRNKMSEPLPSCLFTSLPNIKGLHLSGNELTGRGFTIKAWPSTLRNLVLSHNRLSSSIPLSLQKSMTQLELFDVSFNRIDGVLTGVNLLPSRSSFSAKVNRFSGLLSPPIIAAPRGSVSVLEGSLIDCSDRQAQLPVNDPFFGHFKCGSLTFNAFLYTFAGLLVFTLSFLAWQARFSWVVLLAWVFPATDAPVLDDSKVSLLGQQLKFLESERRFCFSLMAVLIAVLLPTYGTLSATQGTHTFLYAWAVSAAFKGGVASAATMLVLWSGLLTFSDWHFSRTRRASIEVDSEKQDEDSRLPSVSGLRNSKSSARVLLLLRLILIFSVNFVIIMPVNIGYVFDVASYDNSIQTTAAIMLTAFKQFWNKFVLTEALRNPALFFGVTAEEIAVFRLEAMLGGFAFELFLVALNSVVIPALALLTADSNCFRTALYAPDPVVSSYTSEACTMTTISTQGGSSTQNFVCKNTVQRSVSYQPAFTYGFQCSASLLKTYAPIFLLVALYSFAGEPVLHWCVRAALSRWPWLKSFHLLRLIPRIMHLPSERRIEEQSRTKAKRTAGGHRFYRILDARAVYMSLLQDLMLLFTFGVVAPLLGLVLLSALVLKSLRWHHLIVAFASSGEEKQGGGVDALLADLSDFSQTQHPFFKARWFILGYASLFLSFFLIDTAGDAEKRGWINAMWAPALMWVLPALLSLALQLFLPPGSSKEAAAPDPAKSILNEEAVWRGSLELQTLETDTREGSLSGGRLSGSAPVSGRATVAAAQELGWATANPLQSQRRSGNANPQQHLSLDTVKATPRLRSLDEARYSAKNTATL